jgi:hypothetical protein
MRNLHILYECNIQIMAFLSHFTFFLRMSFNFMQEVAKRKTKIEEKLLSVRDGMR